MQCRRPITLIIIASLVGCPFLCREEAVAAHKSAGCANAEPVLEFCCSTNAPQHGVPDQCPESQHPAGDCLCRGVIIGIHQHTDCDFDDQAGLVYFFDVPQGEHQSLPPAAEMDRRPVSCHFSTADSGRELRALIESFLL